MNFQNLKTGEVISGFHYDMLTAHQRERFVKVLAPATHSVTLDDDMGLLFNPLLTSTAMDDDATTTSTDDDLPMDLGSSSDDSFPSTTSDDSSSDLAGGGGEFGGGGAGEDF